MEPKIKQQDAYFKARILDAVECAEVRNCPKFVGFLNEEEAARASLVSDYAGFHRYRLFGGYEGAERVFFGAAPAYLEPEELEFPIYPVTITYRKQDSLGHRDFLGALMGLMITRESIGDILVEEGRCVLFATEVAAKVILQELCKVGKTGVSCTSGIVGELPIARETERISGTVASPRLDSVVSLLTKKGREKSAELIRAGLVSLNHLPSESVSTQVHPGDRLTIRKFGKYSIEELGPLTKKGRLVIVAYQYK